MTIIRKHQSGGWMLPLFSIGCLLAALALFVTELLAYSQRGDRLPANVNIAGVDVGGLSPSQVAVRLQQMYFTPLTLLYRDSPIQLGPQVVGFRVDTDAMLAEVSQATTSGAHFWGSFVDHLFDVENSAPVTVPVQSQYQTNLLRDYLRELAARYDVAPGNAISDLTSLQTFPGSSGYQLDLEAALPLVESALDDPNERRVILPVLPTASRPGDMATLRSLLIDYLDSQGFIYDGASTIASIFILDLRTGEELHVLSDVPFTAASMTKLAVLLNYYRTLYVPPDDDEAYLMANSLLCSNNSSTNLLLQTAGAGDPFAGLAATNHTSAQLGARNSFITALYDLGTGESYGSISPPATEPNPGYSTQPDPYNQTTTEDLGTLFAMLYDCANFRSGAMLAFPDGEFTPTECRQMLELTSANDLERLLQGGIPPNARISHKNGWDGATMHGDAGIVYSPNGNHYVIAVFVWENSDFFSYDIAWPLIEEISRAAWNHFNPEAPLLARRDDLPTFAADCESNYLPPYGEVDLNDINAWRGG